MFHNSNNSQKIIFLNSQCLRCSDFLHYFHPKQKRLRIILASCFFLSIIFLFSTSGNGRGGLNNDLGYQYSNLIPEFFWGYRQDLVEAGDWQEIHEIGRGAGDTDATKFFVYSAYLDFYKSENIIRIISITPSHSSKPLFCHLFDAELHPLGFVGGVVKSTLWAITHLPYSPGFILCNLQYLLQKIEDSKSKNASSSFLHQIRYVAISPTSWDQGSPETPPLMISNLLPIINSQSYTQELALADKTIGNEEPHEFGLCVQPIFEFNKVLAFIQFVEFYRMMGVRHFTFYNISISPEVSCVIQHYVDTNETEIQVLPWNQPFPSDKEGTLMHNHAQVAQENDCILRYRGIAKYVVGVDLDEFILPSEGIPDFKGVISAVDKEHGNESAIAQYQFRQRFFGTECSMFGDPSTEEGVVMEDLLLYRHVQATAELTPHDIRSKYITVPKLVIEPGIHWMREGVGSSVEVKVGESLAYIRHYRDDCKKDRKCAGSGFEVDMLGYHYAPQLLPRVAKIVEKVVGESSKCNLELREMRKNMYCKRGK